MKLKDEIILNGADPKQYSIKELKQIKFLLTSKKMNSWAAHKQLVEKYGFRCVADEPCSHPSNLPSASELYRELLKVEQLPTYQQLYGKK